MTRIPKIMAFSVILCVFGILMLFSPIITFGAIFCVSDEAELQAALTTAASNGEDNVIRITQGTYNGNFTYASTEGYSLIVEGGYTEGCASREIDPANTILDGGEADTVLALVSQEAGNFSVEGLTLQNGNASTVDDGGGLYAKTEDGNVTLTNNVFSGNTASSCGGGAYVISDITLSNNTFSRNTSSGNGGGTYIYRSASILTNNLFTDNTSSDKGGGIYADGSALTLTNNTLSGNTAENQGGCVWVTFIDHNKGGKLYNNIIWNNNASETKDLYIDNRGDDPFFPCAG